MRAIITGAANGIGRAVASLLATADRASLLLTDRDGDGLQTLADQLSRSAPIETMAGDLTDPGLPDRLVARCVDRFGGIDAIISNAGAVTGAPLHELSLQDFDFSFQINTRPTWLLGKAAYPHLAASRGSIVATASMSAEHPTPPLGAYSASKAALLMLVRQMALEWGLVGIRANCVSPGPTVTGITAASYADPDRRAQRASAIPLGKVAEPDDIARAIRFLVQPDAAYISGQNLVVDGGMGTALMVLSGAGSGLSTKPGA